MQYNATTIEYYNRELKQWQNATLTNFEFYENGDLKSYENTLGMEISYLSYWILCQKGRHWNGKPDLPSIVSADDYGLPDDLSETTQLWINGFYSCEYDGWMKYCITLEQMLLYNWHREYEGVYLYELEPFTLFVVPMMEHIQKTYPQYERGIFKLARLIVMFD